jgi:hypothetical protein
VPVRIGTARRGLVLVVLGEAAALVIARVLIGE